MKRSALRLEDVADWHNLAAAFYLATRGKGERPEVTAFRQDWAAQLATMRQEILAGTIPVGAMTRFQIHDPKPRIIHAPCFRERVLHHAVMAQMGPVLDRTLVFDTYACRTGKGTLAAVQRCQQHARRFPWFAKIDIRAYFASIDHERLRVLLRRCFKNPGLLNLTDRIIDVYHTHPGKGLPIGALTSQHFANVYLSGLDRLLLEACRVAGMVRYMDDVIWWGDSREAVNNTLRVVNEYVQHELRLQIKAPVQINRSANGVTMCGYRVLPGILRLSRRRRRRYAQCRRRWERAYADGCIEAPALQAGYAAALAMTAHADAVAWRQEQLRRSPLAESCQWL